MKKLFIVIPIILILVSWSDVLAFPWEAGNADTGNTSSPAIPPPPVTNGKIAFYSTRYSTQSSANYEICSVNADGTGLTRLTTASAHDWCPSYSPDGKKIAFARGNNSITDIYVMNNDGTGSVRLTTTTNQFNFNPKWSADGTKIVYSSKSSNALDPNSDIWVMNSADGSGQEKLTTDNSGDNTPAWSPDGSRIAWRATRAGSNQIWLMNSDGTNPAQLTSESSGAYSPAWSPDGVHIAYNSSNNIIVIKTDGTGRTQLTDTGKDNEPAWSPDGSRIVFWSQRSMYGARDIWTMKADGSDLFQVTDDTYADEAPSWQPAYLPSIETLEATDIEYSSATLNGNLTGSGTAASCDVSFEWWSDPANKHYTASITKVAPCTFTANLTGLSEGVTYSFRAKAMGIGTSYGEEAAFTTEDSSVVRLSIDETLLLTDSPALYPPVSLTVHETFPFSDAPGIVMPAVLIVNESLVISDNPFVTPPAMLSVNEVLAFSDTQVITPPAQISVLETFSLSDFPQAIPTITLTVNEAFIVTDTPSLFPPVALNVNEPFAFSDNQVLTPPAILLVSEAVSFSDTPALSRPVILDVTETIGIKDLPGLFPPVSLVVNESVHASDSPLLLLPVYLTISESIVISDSSVLLPPQCLTVKETINTADIPGVFPPASLTLNEMILASDSPHILVPVLLTVIETVAAIDSPAASLNRPVIIAATPAAGSTGIGYRQIISVTFSKPMDYLSAENAFSMSPAIPGKFTWTGNTMIFTPMVDLSQGATYTVTISTLASDLESTGNHLEQAYTFSFSTQSGCFIFTAAYGSSLAGEVRILQDFRSGAGTSSVTGRGFFSIFNDIYYSFSPKVAGFISSAEPVRQTARVLLTPLVWTAGISAHTSSMLGAVDKDVGILLSLILAGALAGVIYLVPVLVIASTVPRRCRRIKAGKRVRAAEVAFVAFLLASLVLWWVGERGVGSFLATVLSCGLAAILLAHAVRNRLVGQERTG